jgi:hypothetical protein
LDEYKEVLKSPRVRPHLTWRVINLIRERAEEIKARSTVEISLDTREDPYYVCAEQDTGDFMMTLNPSDFPGAAPQAKAVPPAGLAESEAVQLRN